MKKINNTVKEKKMRIETQTWGLNETELSFEMQLNILNELVLNDKINDKYSKLIINHIKTKIQSYKQQDTIKKIYNEDEFINLEQVINLLQETKLKCHYCKQTYYELGICKRKDCKFKQRKISSSQLKYSSV